MAYEAGMSAEEIETMLEGDHSYFVYVTVEGIDEFYGEVVANGAALTQTLADKPWGMRELGVRTPDGHRLMFGQEL